jgi:hypothetical protein
MIPARTRASDSPIYRQRVDAIARLASTRTRPIRIVERVAAAATEWTGHTTAFCVGPRARRGVDLQGLRSTTPMRGSSLLKIRWPCN